jgi:adenine-specific DNA-methyltransferase
MKPQYKTPSTRYYGSKRKLLSWINDCLQISQIEYDCVLDLFGGSASFSYFMKTKQKKVIYNDFYRFNQYIGRALIENKRTVLETTDIDFLLTKHNTIDYRYPITEYYDGFYYPQEENIQIDIALNNITHLDDEMLKACMYYILFQSCLMKRPFNLFHRKNLDIRTRDVNRSFGNKTSWETPFSELFYRFGKELNQCVFDNGKDNSSHNYSALECPLTADLVYLDPPYISKKSHTTYQSRYHFLEALAYFPDIQNHIDWNKKNREFKYTECNDFESRTHIFMNLKILIDIYKSSFIMLSYRTGGIPTIDEIKEYLISTGRKYNCFNRHHSYALHKNNGYLEEILFIVYPLI